MTSIEWLASQLGEHIIWEEKIIDLVEQAKQLHKQEIINAADQNQFEDIDGGGIFDMITKGEQYYGQEYGK